MNRFRGLIHSQRVLLALTQKGVSREDSLRARPAQRDEGLGAGRRLPGRAQGRPGGARGAVARPRSRRLFDLGYHTKHVDTIFARVFGAVTAGVGRPRPRAERRRPHPRPRARQPARRAPRWRRASTTPLRGTPSGALIGARGRARARRPALSGPPRGAPRRPHRRLGRHRHRGPRRLARRRDPRHPRRRTSARSSPGSATSAPSPSTAPPPPASARQPARRPCRTRPRGPPVVEPRPCGHALRREAPPAGRYWRARL